MPPSGFLRCAKCLTVRSRASLIDTSGMYPRSSLALLQSSCLFALAMRMRIGVNSEGGISCTAAPTLFNIPNHSGEVVQVTWYRTSLPDVHRPVKGKLGMAGHLLEQLFHN